MRGFAKVRYSKRTEHGYSDTKKGPEWRPINRYASAIFPGGRGNAISTPDPRVTHARVSSGINNRYLCVTLTTGRLLISIIAISAVECTLIQQKG